MWRQCDVHSNECSLLFWASSYVFWWYFLPFNTALPFGTWNQCIIENPQKILMMQDYQHTGLFFFYSYMQVVVTGASISSNAQCKCHSCLLLLSPVFHPIQSSLIYERWEGSLQKSTIPFSECGDQSSAQLLRLTDPTSLNLGSDVRKHTISSYIFLQRSVPRSKDRVHPEQKDGQGESFTILIPLSPN